MTQASPLRLLSRTERAGLFLGDAVSRRWPWASRAWSVPICPVLWLVFGRRVRATGLEHLAGLAPTDRVLVASNHRSYFDFYLTALVLRWWARLPHRLLFPVRAPFFYDHPLGVALNFAASGMAMFPPIFRGDRGRSLNELSLARCVDELRRPGTLIGMHPEGTRNDAGDPLSLLPARRGIGRLALEVPEARVVPAFVLGLGNRIGRELWTNWSAPSRHPIHVRFGPEVDLADLRGGSAGVGRAEAERAASERCRQAILSLARGVLGAEPPAH